MPGAAVTSDFIVGFCGETEADFQATMELVRWGRFKNSFIFKYSPRPRTKAAELYADDVPEEVKRRRNNELLAVQNAISLEDNQPFLGREVEILVEGPSKSAPQAPGRRRRGAVGGPHRLRPDRDGGRPAAMDGPAAAGDDREGGCLYAVREGFQRPVRDGRNKMKAIRGDASHAKAQARSGCK